MNEPQKLLQEAAAAQLAAQAAAAAAAVTSRSSSVSPAVTTSAASNPYSALAALAVASSGGSPTSPYLRPPLGAASFGAPPPSLTGNGGGASADNSWLMSPLIQVALWQQQQQQLQQRLSQIASMSGGSPFMNPALIASLGGSFPPAAAAQPQPPPLPPLIPTSTTASLIASEAAKSVTNTSSTPTTMGLDNVYREYLNKIVEQGGQKSAASEAAEVMANLIKASEDKTNGNSKPNLFESSSTSAMPQSSIGVSQAALVAAAAAAGVDVHKPVLQHQVTSPPRNMPVNPARTNGGGRSSGDGSGTNPPTYNGKDKVFTCQTCNRSFGYKHVLQNHERTHTGEKPFECKVCNKRFTRDHHLKTHMRLHTGEKPYSCTHCDRQFVQVANLRRHLRVHTGERPYKCDACLSTFSDSNQLKAHILIHKGEKPFACDKCSGKFRRRHHLMHHVCPMVPGSSQKMKLPLPPDLDDDQDDDERFILAAKRARSASMKEGMYEETPPPSLLAQLSQNTPPSNLELSLMLAQARAAQERAAQEHARARQLSEQRGSPPVNNMPVSLAGSLPLALTPPIQQQTQQRSRKNRDPKRLNPSASPSEEELPQSEPEDLSSKKSISGQEAVNLDLLAITTSEAVLAATNPKPPTAPTLSQMPIANK